MSALHEDSLRAVLDQLRLQRWTLSPSVDGKQWRAEPPEGGRAVLFSSRPAVLSPVIRQLQDRGFVWPPRETSDTSVIRAAPFQPAPHPDVAIEGHEALPRGPLALVKPHGVEPPKLPATADEAFALLKEAQAYAVLAADELRGAVAARKAAQEIETEAKVAYDDASAQLAERKAGLDAFFSRPVSS